MAVHCPRVAHLWPLSGSWSPSCHWRHHQCPPCSSTAHCLSALHLGCPGPVLRPGCPLSAGSGLIPAAPGSGVRSVTDFTKAKSLAQYTAHLRDDAVLIRLNQDVVTPEGPAASAPAHPTQTIALHWILAGQRGHTPLHHFKTGNRRIAPSYSRKQDSPNLYSHVTEETFEATAFNESIQSVYLFHYLWPFSITSSLLAWRHDFGRYEVCVSRKAIFEG